MDTADAANWRRENTLLLGMFVFLFSKCGSRFCDLRFHPVVGPVLPFSTSRERKVFRGKESALACRFLQPRKYKGEGWEMMTALCKDNEERWRPAVAKILELLEE